MTLLSLDQLLEGARAQARAWAPWRRKQADVDMVRSSQHDLAIPAAILRTGRARPVYSCIAQEKLKRAKAILSDRQGPLVVVTTYGIAQRTLRDRDIVQAWASGVLSRIDADVVHEDLLVRGYSLVRVLPNDSWTALPQLPTQEPDETDEEYAVRRQAVEAERDRLRHTVFPISVEWVPAMSAAVVEVAGRPTEVWEFREMPVAEVLATWRDPETGQPLARHLAELVGEQPLTDEDVVVVVSRADDEHFQIAITTQFLEEYTSPRQSRMFAASCEEMVWEGPHGMGRLPYAMFRGNVSNIDSPPYRYGGFLDDVIDLVPRYDELLTQLYSACRITAWPTLIERVERGALGGDGDAIAPLEIEEGGVTQLPAGHDLINPRWTSSDDLQWILRTVQLLRHEIDIKTFPETMLGLPAASSGYHQNLIENAAEDILYSFEKGACQGWSEVVALALRAAAALFERGSEPIPVLVTTPDGSDYVTIRREQTRYEWSVRVSVRSRPVGGEAALAQILASEVNNGWISNQTAMERLGVRNPSREIARIMLERTFLSPKVTEMLQEIAVSRAMLAASNATTTRPPQQPTVDQGLASVTQTPTLRALLPNDVPLGGTPNPAANPPAPPPPPPTSGIAAGQLHDIALRRPGGRAYGAPAGAGGTGSFGRAEVEQ